MKSTQLLTGLFLLQATVSNAAALKVYILAGQSNMQGHGQASTVSYMGYDPQTKPLHDKIVDENGNLRVYENIRIAAYSETGPGNDKMKAGPLTMGYGSDLASDTVCGPELAFGITMAERLGEPILIIKTAWGGKSLNTDFRPRSAGKYELPPDTQALWDRYPNGAHGIPSQADRPTFWAGKEKATGHYYRLMVKHVNETLADIKSVYPAYDPVQGYEIAGFVWFQGWNDMCDSTTYPDRNNPGGYAEYTTLMAHFIRDVRQAFKAPGMHFVIGVIGVEGDKAKGGLANLRSDMAAPAAMEEFSGTVAAVETKDFWDYRMAVMSRQGFHAKKGVS